MDMGPIGHTILGGFVTWLYACMIQKKLKNSQGILIKTFSYTFVDKLKIVYKKS